MAQTFEASLVSAARVLSARTRNLYYVLDRRDFLARVKALKLLRPPRPKR